MQESCARPCTAEVRHDTKSRRFLFGVGDVVFLGAVGAVSTTSMCLAHQWGWPFLLAMFAGMAIAMILQMVMAFCISPLLGSIESMTPSMIVGMISPMVVCTMHLFGCELSCGAAALLGTSLGIAMFLFVQWYSVLCRERLRTVQSAG